jgi:hypothetical protein
LLADAKILRQSAMLQRSGTRSRARESYRTAELRLRKALVDVAAGDATALVARVFEDRCPDRQ